MPSLAETLLTTFIALTGLMLAIWLLSIFLRDASIADPVWGCGFIVVAWLSISLNDPASSRAILLACLTTIWGLRLSLFLLWRNWGTAEDRRYAAMRSHHGDRFLWVSLFTVFLLQGSILWFVSLPIQVAITRQTPNPLGLLDVVGVACFATGVFFEAVSDWQLACFRADANNAGKVLDRGLWHYTRHPNYFGDFCVWWGLYLIAAAGGAAWMVLSPLLMSYLLLRVSGVVLLENTISDRRPEYIAYRARTNAFFPSWRILCPFHTSNRTA